MSVTDENVKAVMDVLDQDENWSRNPDSDGWVYNIQGGARAILAAGFRKVEAAPSDTDRDFKRIPAEIRSELIHMAEGRIKDVWADSPEGVDASTLASNVVAAQEFVWMQLAAGVDLRTPQPVQVEVTETPEIFPGTLAELDGLSIRTKGETDGA